MKIIVNPHKLEIVKEPVNELEVNITKCEFEFSEEITNDYTKEAYFTLNNGNTYKQIIFNNECDIPNEVLVSTGTVQIGVVAYLISDEEVLKRYNPSPVHITILAGSLKEAENSRPITPSEMEQFEQELNESLEYLNSKLDIMDTAITEANNLNIDANKVSHTTTIEVTKKDGTTKQVQVFDGEKGDSGLVAFQLDGNGHLIAISESASNYENYSIGADGHLYIDLGE